MTPRVLAALAVALLGAAYLPGLGAPLIWDDKLAVTLNPALGRPASSTDYLTNDYFAFSREATWRPLSTLTLRLQRRVFGAAPAPSRAAGLLLHAVNAGLLLLVLARMRPRPPGAELAAALFLVHPVHVETLSCLSFNEEPLCALGLLSGLLLHQRGLAPGAALAFGCAMLAKETGLLALPLAAAYDAFQGGRERTGQNMRAYALYGAVAGAYALIRFVLLPGPAIPPSSFEPGFASRLGLAALGLATAVRVYLLPVRLRIEYPAIPPASGEEWAAAAAAVVLAAAVLVGGGRLALRERPQGFWGLWALAFLLSTANLVPVPVLSMRLLAERWLYLLALGASVILARVLQPRPALAAGALLAFGLASAYRSLDWRDEVRLWRSLVTIYPWCSAAHEGLGKARLARGESAEAAEELREALRLREGGGDRLVARYPPRNARDMALGSLVIRNCLGLALLQSGRDREAEEILRQAAMTPAGGVFAHKLLAQRAASSGDFAAARAWIDAGLRRSKADALLLRLRSDVDRGIRPPPVRLEFGG